MPCVQWFLLAAPMAGQFPVVPWTLWPGCRAPNWQKTFPKWGWVKCHASGKKMFKKNSEKYFFRVSRQSLA